MGKSQSFLTATAAFVSIINTWKIFSSWMINLYSFDLVFFLHERTKTIKLNIPEKNYFFCFFFFLKFINRVIPLPSNARRSRLLGLTGRHQTLKKHWFQLIVWICLDRSSRIFSFHGILDWFCLLPQAKSPVFLIDSFLVKKSYQKGQKLTLTIS